MKSYKFGGIKITNDTFQNTGGAPDLLEPYYNMPKYQSVKHIYAAAVHDDDITMSLISGNSHEMPTLKAWWRLTSPTRDVGVTFNAIPQYFKIKPRMSYGDNAGLSPGQDILFIQLYNAEDTKSAWLMQYLSVYQGLYGYVMNRDS